MRKYNPCCLVCMIFFITLKSIKMIWLILVTIPLRTYGISPPEAAIVCCGRRPQHSLVIREPIRRRRLLQLLVAEGHKDLWVRSPTTTLTLNLVYLHCNICCNVTFFYSNNKIFLSVNDAIICVTRCPDFSRDFWFINPCGLRPQVTMTTSGRE